MAAVGPEIEVECSNTGKKYLKNKNIPATFFAFVNSGSAQGAYYACHDEVKNMIYCTIYSNENETHEAVK